MSKEVYEALELAKKYQEYLNNVVTFIDVEKQLENNIDGKLKGLAVGLKDNVSTKGIKTTASSRILENYVPTFDATIVEKLRDEGAIFICKTSMDELAMGGNNLTSVTGPVHNPYDLNRIAGGSSGGSASLVASGVCKLAIGSDTGDSVRRPAGFCGVVGVKPSYGRISRYGIIPYASSLDTVGYFASNVNIASLALEVLAGRDDRDMTSSNREVLEYSKFLNDDINGKKIAIFKNVVDAISDKDTIDTFYELIEKLKEKGAIVDEVSFDDKLLRAMFPTYYIIANCEATANHSNLDGIRFGNTVKGNNVDEIMINTRTNGFGSLIKKRFVIGSYGLFEENQEKIFRKAQRVRRLIVDALRSVLDEYDCLIAPSSNSIAPYISDDSKDKLSDNYLIAENHLVLGNFSGYPSMTLPMGFKDGCPLGVNITCSAFDEMNMFNIGLAIENATGLKDLVAKVK